MWISYIDLENFKSFSRAKIQLSKGINLVVGPNNSGKSTLLNSILWIQFGFNLRNTDIRVHKTEANIKLSLEDLNSDYFNLVNSKEFILTASVQAYLRKKEIRIEILNYRGNTIQNQVGNYSLNISNKEPNNFIYPYLSKRKVINFNENINSETASSVNKDLQNLYARIDQIANTQIPANEEYVQACDDILGFRISATSSEQGKKGAYIVDNWDSIPLAEMGEGISNLVGIIINLCFAKNKLFLIEEPENDVHPKALKKLLKFIASKSKDNQFIITTHSNIVTKYLGAQPDSKIFNITMGFENKIPTSYIEEVENSQEARYRILEDLGYDFFDFDLWSAWLILEESSAEKIIREYLISWFTPDLKEQLRTYSARSLSEVETKFDDFNNLFVFLHLQPVYKNKVWVVVDGGENEKEVIEKLKDTYSSSGKGWSEDHFLQFQEHDFEKYYPAEFQAQVDSVLNEPDRQKRREGKKQLLQNLDNWIASDEERAKQSFEISAAEVIQCLQQIEASLKDER